MRYARILGPVYDRGPRSFHAASAPGILLGIGLGGFVDGILLHQILQWHHMLTSEGSYPKTTVAGLETNTLWDGLFHAAGSNETAWNLAFLAFGALLVIGGWLLARSELLGRRAKLEYTGR